jgi:hypothetical protein
MTVFPQDNSQAHPGFADEAAYLDNCDEASEMNQAYCRSTE